jgi:hypothetical protein
MVDLEAQRQVDVEDNDSDGVQVCCLRDRPAHRAQPGVVHEDTDGLAQLSVVGCRLFVCERSEAQR